VKRKKRAVASGKCLGKSLVGQLVYDHIECCRALRDLLAFYDRVTVGGHDSGWTAAEALRLNEIRKLACPDLRMAAP
jgi:hypothetical protein